MLLKIKTKSRWIWIVITLVAVLAVVSVQAQEGIINESFDDPTLTGWELTGNAEVIEGDLNILGEGSASYPADWSDIFMFVRASLEGDGFIEISYRQNPAGEYLIQIGQEEIILYRADQVLAAEPIGFIPPGEWFLLEILAVGDSHEINLNGQPVLNVSDPEMLPAGGIVLSVEGDAHAKYDELFLESLVESPPEEELEPEEQEETETEASQPAEEITEAPAGGEFNWVRTGGPPGGIGYDIRYKFDQPTTWFVTENFSGVHVSTDNGLTWQPSTEGIPKQLGPTGDWRPVFSLTVDPHNPDIIWAGTDKTGRIYKSTDGGKTWTVKDNGIIKQTSVYDYLSFRGFTIDPKSSDTVYAMGEIGNSAEGGPLGWSLANGGVIYKSTDGGENWELIWDGGIPSSLARYMWINPQNTDILYVSTGIFDRSAVGEGDPETDPDPYGGLGVLKSTNGGKSWRILDENNGLNFLYINSLFMHPEDPDVLIAGAAFGETELYEQYLNENNLQTPMGVYRTADGGESWTQVLAVRGGLNAVEICPSDPNIVYAASSTVVYRSQDAGLTWTQVAGQGGNGWGPPGVLAGKPIDMQCDPQDPDRLFTNNYLGGNFLTTDGGKTWVNASDGYTGAQIVSVEVDPKNPAKIYVAGRNGIWGSRDAGKTWYGLRYPEPGVSVWGGEWGGIAIDPSDSQHLLVSEETIWESFDSGSEWKIRESPGFAMGAVFVFAPSDPNIVYTGRAEPGCLLNMEAPCAEGSGVYVSNDGGTTWKFANDSNIADKMIIDLAVDQENAQIVYAATQNGLYRTVDGGSNWNLLQGLPAGARVDAITLHPLDSEKMLAGVETHGLYNSSDGGQTWQQVAAGLEANNSIRDILYDPTDSNIVYLSDLMSGIYRSTDGGENWKQINDGLSTRSTTRMGISADGQHLYTSTNGGGIFRLDLNGQAPVPVADTLEEEKQQKAEEPEEPESVEEEEDQIVSESAEEPDQEKISDQEDTEENAGNPGFLIGLIIGVGATLIISGTAAYLWSRKRSST